MICAAIEDNLDSESLTVTIKSWLHALGRRHQAPDECPIWPPDLFAICGTLLKRSGAYLQVFDRQGASDPLWSKAHGAGKRWQNSLNKLQLVSLPHLRSALPSRVRTTWKNIIAHAGTPLSTLRNDAALTHDLICLAVMADEASAGIGVTSKDSGAFLGTAQVLLEANRLVSFTWDVPPDSVCVLGKQHTPQRDVPFSDSSFVIVLAQRH